MCKLTEQLNLQQNVYKRLITLMENLILKGPHPIIFFFFLLNMDEGSRNIKANPLGEK